jgi:hypothetical protein
MGNYQTQNLKHLIWIDPNVDNEENKKYISNMKEIGFKNIQSFKTIEDGINYLKTIKFESTKIILSGRLFIDFIKKFKENIKEMLIIPKIAVFTGDKEKFLEYNKDKKDNLELINDAFYSFGKINETYEEIKEFLIQKTTEENKPIDKKRKEKEKKKKIEKEKKKEEEEKWKKN